MWSRIFVGVIGIAGLAGCCSLHCDDCSDPASYAGLIGKEGKLKVRTNDIPAPGILVASMTETGEVVFQSGLQSATAATSLDAVTLSKSPVIAPGTGDIDFAVSGYPFTAVIGINANRKNISLKAHKVVYCEDTSCMDCLVYAGCVGNGATFGVIRDAGQLEQYSEKVCVGMPSFSIVDGKFTRVSQVCSWKKQPDGSTDCECDFTTGP